MCLPTDVHYFSIWHSINGFFVTEAECVSCDVRPGSLNVDQVLFSLSSFNEFEKPLSVISVVYEGTSSYSL
jgi:hypothetical protein